MVVAGHIYLIRIGKYLIELDLHSNIVTAIVRIVAITSKNDGCSNRTIIVNQNNTSAIDNLLHLRVQFMFSSRAV